MTYTWAFGKKFATEFSYLIKSDQDKILDFIDIFETSGLSDFSLYAGKITPSWTGNNISSSDSAYARANCLWHYHIGIPTYQQVHSKYKTSEWLLHFQWLEKGIDISIIDLYSHYTSEGDFYLPPESYL